MTLPKLDTKCAALAELTFDRGRFELQAARVRTMIDAAQAALRSKGCRDRDGNQLTKPYPFVLCEAGSFKTVVFGRWMDKFNEMHADHRARCVRCSAYENGEPMGLRPREPLGDP
jgi:hypothetical protein